MKRNFCVIRWLFLLWSAGLAQSGALSHHNVVVRAGRLFSGLSDTLLKNQVIVISFDKIAQVGPSEEVNVPHGADLIDLSRATVLPGLIDAHTHVFENGPDLELQTLRYSWQYRTLIALANAQKDLMAGFTTLRDLKTVGALYSDVDLRNAINQGVVSGPRMQVATRGIQATGGFILKGWSSEVPIPMAMAVADSGPFPHGSQTKEFEYLVQFGMTPAQAMRAATSEAARLMGWDRAGSVETGKFADLVAVSGDPLSDIAELERVRFA